MYLKKDTCTHIESIDSPVASREVKGPYAQWVGAPFPVVCNSKIWSSAVTTSPHVQGIHLLNLMRFRSHLERSTITSLYNLCDKYMPTFFWPLFKLHNQTLHFYINNFKSVMWGQLTTKVVILEENIYKYGKRQKEVHVGGLRLFVKLLE